MPALGGAWMSCVGQGHPCFLLPHVGDVEGIEASRVQRNRNRVFAGAGSTGKQGTDGSCSGGPTRFPSSSIVDQAGSDTG